MSVLFNQTNISPATSQFITRAEVILGFSTLAGDLSGINISSLVFNNPNPSLSTIRMNPNGFVSGAAYDQAGRQVVSTVGSLAPAFLGLNNPQMTIMNTNGQITQDLYAKNFGATNSLSNANNPKIFYSYQGISAQPTTGPSQPLATWIPAVGTGTSGWNLANVSSINGVPVLSSFTSYTTLNGQNINNTGVINTPSVVGLSSLNGAAYPPQTIQTTNLTASNVALSSMTATGGITSQKLTVNSFPLFNSNYSPLIYAKAPSQPIYWLGGLDNLVPSGGSSSLTISSINGNIISANAQSAGTVNVVSVQLINNTQAVVYSAPQFAGQPVWWQLWTL